MTVALLVILICLMLLSFKTVRTIIGIFVFFAIMVYLYGPKEPHASAPQTTITEPNKPAPTPAPKTIVTLPDAMLGGWCFGPPDIRPDAPPGVGQRISLDRCYGQMWRNFTAEAVTRSINKHNIHIYCTAKLITKSSKLEYDVYTVTWVCTEYDNNGRPYTHKPSTSTLHLQDGFLIKEWVKS